MIETYLSVVWAFLAWASIWAGLAIALKLSGGAREVSRGR